MRITTHSEKETKKIASLLAEAVLESKMKGPTIISMVGNLGSGKTTFIQGFARGLGIKKRLTSPTFLIWRKYQIPRSKRSAHLASASQNQAVRYEQIYHVDVYRIKKPNELTSLGFKEIVSDPKNIVLIEWADKIKRILPKEGLLLKLRHGKQENERIIEFKPKT